MTCSSWDIIVVPFPFADSPTVKPRPVLIISEDKFNEGNNHCVAAMITTAANSKWLGDSEISDIKKSGLTKKSFIRLKFFTLDLNFDYRKIGSLSAKDKAAFKKNFKKYIKV